MRSTCPWPEDGYVFVLQHALKIADEIGMSVQVVSRYARFADKVRSARASSDRRENVSQTGTDQAWP
jgi:hypothetical protein